MRRLSFPARLRLRDAQTGEQGAQTREQSAQGGEQGGQTAEQGAIAVLVALLLGSGVLLGVGALVIDVGTLTVEREQLQSGADAAAWAIASTCADAAPACDTPGQTAARYADANAKDGAAAVTTAVCRDTCGGTGAVAPCPAVPAALNGGLAQVRASTLTSDGSTVLPPILAQAMGNTGTTVITCSQVVWGVADRGTVLGAGVGLCKWQQSTGGDAQHPAGTEVQLDLDTPCPSSTAPEVTWIGGDDCAPTLAVDDVVAGSDGTGCGDALDAARESGAPVLVPIIDRAATGGYHVVGLGGFVVTDYVIHDPGDVGGLAPAGCTPDTTCVSGHFTRIVVPAHDTLPGTTDDYGATVLSRIG
jgi:Flp pilus assembly protein TadG